MDDAFAVIKSTTSGAKYFTYASVTDNLSQDPVCIIPVGRGQTAQQVEMLPNRESIKGVESSPKVISQRDVPWDATAKSRVNDQWETHGPRGESVAALVINPVNNQIVYAGTWDGGVYRTTDGGESWIAFDNGLSTRHIEAIAIDPTNPQIIYAGGWGGIFKSTNGGEIWSAVNSGLTTLDVSAIAIDPSNSKIIYAASSGVCKSTDGGNSWTVLNTGIKKDDFVTVLEIDPINNQTVYAGTWSEGVYKSTNGGTLWSSISTGLTSSCVVALAIDHVNPQIIYAGMSWGGGLNKSTNGGGQWTAVDIGQSYPWVYAIAVNPINPQTIYVGEFGHGVYRTTNSGVSWTVVNSGLSETNVWSIAIDPNSPQTIYAGTRDGGVFRRDFAVAPASPAIYLPAAANVKGSVDTNWHTDLEVHNSDATQASFAIALLSKDQDNTTPTTKTYSLGTNQSVRYSDVLQSLFSLTGSATLCVVPSEGSLMATSRTYNQLTTGNLLGLPAGATFGQFIPGKPDTDAIPYGQTGKLIQFSQYTDETQGFRTNMGFTSVAAIPITIEIKLYRGDGTFIATKTVDLAPFGFKQVNNIFINVMGSAMDDGYAEVKSTTPGGRFFAYASVTDNKSGDPIYIPAVVR